jgi:uncharacterized protein with HEPN domain
MSVSRDWRLLIQDIIDYGSDALDATRGMDYEAFVANRIAQLAVTRCLEIMGEAARHVPPEVKSRCPEVAWRQMNDMRNILIHAYRRVDLGLVWGTVTDDVLPTLARLRQLLEEEGVSDS